MVTPIQDVMRSLKAQALGGAKVLHTFSNPVVHKTTDGYCIAHFLSVYTKEQRDSLLLPRPGVWILADLITGKQIREISCGKLDFSQQPKDALCRAGLPEGTAPTKETFEELFRLFDLVRQRYADTGVLDAFTYRAYFRKMLGCVPEDFRVYYQELSAIR